MSDHSSIRDGALTAIVACIAILVVGALLVGGCAGVNSFRRAQKRAAGSGG